MKPKNQIFASVAIGFVLSQTAVLVVHYGNVNVGLVLAVIAILLIAMGLVWALQSE